MAITNRMAGTVILKRVGPLMTAAGMEVDDHDPDLDDPFAWATRQLGHTTADVSDVTDAEMASVAVADYDNFLDLAEYRTLQNILGSLDDVDLAVGPRAEKFSQLAAQARKKLDRLEARLGTWLDVGMVAPSYQAITLQIAEHG